MALYSTETETSATATSEVIIPKGEDVSIQVTLTGTATVDIQGRLDGAGTWVGLENNTGLTASKLITLEGPVHGVRMNVTAYTSGNCIFEVLSYARRG